MPKMRSGHGIFAEVVRRRARRSRSAVVRLVLLFLLVVLLGQGCRARHRNGQSGEALASAKDALGNKISLQEYPRRIVSTAPSNTAILLALGLREKLVGVSSFYGYPEKVRGIAEVGGYINPSVTKVVALRPDLVFAARGNSRDAIEQMRRHGVKVFTLDTRTVDGVLRDIKVVGLLTGTSERASLLIADIEREIRAIEEKVAGLSDREKPTVFWIGQERPLRTAGPGSLVDELIRLAGGTNIAGDEKRAWPSYGTEKLLLRDPEVVILGEDQYKNSPERVVETIAGFKRDAVWRNISAVKEGRVHFIATDLLGQPSPAFVEGLKLLVKCLHPDLFPERAREKGERYGESE